MVSEHVFKIVEACAQANRILDGAVFTGKDSFRMRWDLKKCSRTFWSASQGFTLPKDMTVQEARQAVFNYNASDYAPVLTAQHPHIQEAAFLLLGAASRFESDGRVSEPVSHYEPC